MYSVYKHATGKKNPAGRVSLILILVTFLSVCVHKVKQAVLEKF